MGISAPADDSTAEVRATEIGIADAGIASAGNIPAGAAEAGTAEAAAAEAGAPEAGTADDGAAAAGTAAGGTAAGGTAKGTGSPAGEPARPPERPRRGRGFKVGVALALVLALAGSLAFLLKRQGGTVQAIPPTTAPRGNASLGTAAEVRAAAAAWVASQVSRAKPISCDPVMCQTLHAHGVPAADLLVLKPGGGAPLRSRVIVVTAAVTKMVGTEFLTADAPAAIASFGSGSRQVSVRLIYPQGAAAYAAALRQDIAERKVRRGHAAGEPAGHGAAGRPPAAPGRPGRSAAPADPGAAGVAVAAVHRGVR